MPTLAPKLPYTHPFAGGFPYRGSQRLPSDPDALTYLAAVAAADGAPVETAVAMAVDDFFRGTKADGTFSALKAACLLCGARTLAGALVPLVGAAPTNNNFVDADYNRETGLVGNGSTKYLDSNRANDDDPQNDSHNAVYITDPQIGSVITSGVGVTGINYLDIIASATRVINRDGAVTVSGTVGSGLYASSRSDSAQYDYRTPQGSGTQSGASVTPNALNVLLFVRSDGISLSSYSPARFAFYSIGESLDLAALDARVTALVNAIGAAL